MIIKRTTYHIFERRFERVVHIVSHNPAGSFSPAVAERTIIAEAYSLERKNTIPPINTDFARTYRDWKS